MTQEEQCAVFPTAWNLSLLYMYPRVYVAGAEDYGALCLQCRSARNKGLSEESQT